MKRTYQKVSEEKSKILIELLQTNNMSIKDAAKTAGINYESAKAIYRTRRIKKVEVKMSARARRADRRTRASYLCEDDEDFITNLYPQPEKSQVQKTNK